jgi:DNA-binding MarR family transcriptional regulator
VAKPTKTNDSDINLGPLSEDLLFLTRNLSSLLKPEGRKIRQALEFEDGVIGVLSIIWLNPGISQNDLAASVVLKKSAVTKLLNSLEKSNLVQRHRSKTDGRANALTITAEGHEKIAVVRKLTSEIHDRMFRNIPKQDREIFFSVLLQLLSEIDN